jgi:hypothetical protein
VVAGYDAVVADPASRFDLTEGRIMVRPDGYIGAITSPG